MPPTSRETPDVQAYRRVHDLQRLLPMWPAELADQSTEGRRRRIAKLRRALREERRRGGTGPMTSPGTQPFFEPIEGSWPLSARAARTLSCNNPLLASRVEPGHLSRRVPSPIFLASCDRAAA